jgi:hypothetical protein
VGSKTCPNVRRQSWIMGGIHSWLIICVKNKLFRSVRNPHEHMHQPNRFFPTFYLWKETHPFPKRCVF